jgi:phosphate transport system permease protein
VLLGIIFSLMVGAWPAFKEFGPAFITTVEWDPVNDQYGDDRHCRHAGDLGHRTADRLPGVSFGIAAVPDRNLPGPLRRPLGTAVELLAGIPSIIYGMWGLFVFAPLFGDYVQPFLKSTWANCR